MALASITLDQRNSGAVATGATSVSWTHTVGANLTDKILLALISMTTLGVPQNVYWDHTGANQINLSKVINDVTATINDGALGTTASMWHTLVPAAGSLTLRVESGGAILDISGGSISFSGVSRTQPFNSAGPHTDTGLDAENPLLAVTSGTGQWSVDVLTINIGAGGSVSLNATDQSFIFPAAPTGSDIGCGSDAAGDTSMNWVGFDALGAGGGWGQLAVSLVPSTINSIAWTAS